MWFVSLTLNHWISIYPVDSIIKSSNRSLGLDFSYLDVTGLAVTFVIRAESPGKKAEILCLSLPKMQISVEI